MKPKISSNLISLSPKKNIRLNARSIIKKTQRVKKIVKNIKSRVAKGVGTQKILGQLALKK